MKGNTPMAKLPSVLKFSFKPLYFFNSSYSWIIFVKKLLKLLMCHLSSSNVIPLFILLYLKVVSDSNAKIFVV